MNTITPIPAATIIKRVQWLCCITMLLLSGAACNPKLSKRPVLATAKTSTTTTSGQLLMGSPATSLEVHHININNGDASVIRVVHADGTETKVLIDGGQLSADQRLIPYCNAVFKDASFKYVVLTHYHNDHYNGLMALGDGTIKGDYYIDLGGYSMRGGVSSANLPKIQPQDTTCPWTDVDGIFDGTMGNYLTAVGKAVDNYGLKRYGPMTTTSSNISSLIGVVVPIDTFVSGGKKLPVNLRCVALWGYTMSSTGAAADNWNRGASKNDPCIAFVLECGEFRYFFGGDMGGYSGGSYIDQETTLAGGFQYLYKGAKSFYNPGTTYDGHVCGFKANHHGSDHSNNNTFLSTMKPSICGTSAGDNGSWHLPSDGFMDRLSKTIPVTAPGDITQSGINAQSFLFTNLNNFGSYGNRATLADKLYGKRSKTEYYYGYAGYAVTLDLTDKTFLSGGIWSTTYYVNWSYKLKKGSYIVCHQK